MLETGRWWLDVVSTLGITRYASRMGCGQEETDGVLWEVFFTGLFGMPKDNFHGSLHPLSPT